MTDKALSDKVVPRILVVDDDAILLELLTETVTEAGDYVVLQASNGREAQEILQREPVDVAITDLQMPELDGMQLMNWAQERRLATLWIILSGQGSFEDAVRAIRLGAFDFLIKPLPTLESLVFSVRNAIRQKELERESRQLHQDIEERNQQLSMQVGQLQEACTLLVEQAAQIDEDIRRAELIQRALLPQMPPAVPGVTLDTIYRPCRYVGGDLYDMIGIDDRYLLAYVADAAGHGVSAAMLAVLFKHRLYMTEDSTRQPSHPDEVLRRVNQSLVRECKVPGLFVTAAYCVLDTQTGRLSVASAGHPPLLLQRADGSLEKVCHTGPGLGVDEEAQFGRHDLNFNSGDRLLLYTDGLFGGAGGVALTAGDVMAHIRSSDTGGEELLQQLYNQAFQHQNGEQEDDITMVLITCDSHHPSVDNGRPAEAMTTPQFELPAKAVVLVGEDGGAGVVFSIRGRATWTQSLGFHDQCLEELRQSRSVRLDLSQCQYLDSTFLGTIQELVDVADRQRVAFAIEGACEEVQALFEELGMHRVMRCYREAGEPLPDCLHPLCCQVGQKSMNGLRMLRAHEALASLSEANRAEFAVLLEQLRLELG